MEHGRDKDNEYIIQDMICDNEGDEDVVSLFLNESGEGVEELDRRDGSGEGVEGEVDRTLTTTTDDRTLITTTGKVYKLSLW